MFHSDAGDDYSYLMHNIEGKISSAHSSSKAASAVNNARNIVASTTPSESAAPATIAARESVSSNNVYKRKRVGDNRPEDNEDESFIASLRTNVAANSIRSSSSTLKLQAQLDEFKILNEQLKEQLRSYKDEHQLFKEQSMRQLKYLEESSARYKNQYEQASSKYYKEKKEWQAKARELEHSLHNAKQQSMAAGTTEDSITRTSVIVQSRVFENSLDEDLQQDILDLKERYLEKQSEASSLLKEKLELEKRVFKLEQDAKTLKTLTHGCEEDATEVRMLRKKCNELESTLRKKSKDYEKHDQQLKNQIMLQEELASVQQKLYLAQSTLVTYHNMEVNYGKLLEEQKLWSQLCATILKSGQSTDCSTSETGVTLTDKDEKHCQDSNPEGCSPTEVLRMFSDLQKRHVLLLQQHSDSEVTAVQLQRQALKLENQIRELKEENQNLKETAERLHLKLATASNRSKCYDSEISSLRSLLKTFDVEFSIGKPDAVKMLSLKDRMIDELRTDIDNCRMLIADYSTKISNLETDMDSRNNEQTVIKLEREVGELKADYTVMQELTGLDFLPHKTKILHLVHNPSSFLSSRPGYTARSSMPMDVLKDLKNQIRSLTKQENGTASQSDISAMMDHQFGGNRSQGITTGVVDPNKMNQRLKEIFKEKISTFREAVYLLTGFKVDLTSADPGNPRSLPHIRLRSMFAETPDDSLLFQLRDSTPELLETEFANNLDPTLMMYLTKYNSVPAFLAATTLQLFESQTQI